MEAFVIIRDANTKVLGFWFIFVLFHRRWSFRTFFRFAFIFTCNLSTVRPLLICLVIENCQTLGCYSVVRQNMWNVWHSSAFSKKMFLFAKWIKNIFLTNIFVKHFLTFPFRSTVDWNFDRPFLLIWMTSLVVVQYNCVCRVNSAELSSTPTDIGNQYLSIHSTVYTVLKVYGFSVIWYGV